MTIYLGMATRLFLFTGATMILAVDVLQDIFKTVFNCNNEALTNVGNVAKNCGA